MECTTPAFEKGATPKPGDVSMCLACGYISVFNADMTLRAPTTEETISHSRNPQIMQAQLARSHIVGDKIKERMKKQ